MSSIYRAEGASSDFRSGGKMVRPRRLASSRTPYDQPNPPPAPVEMPNWLSTVSRVLVTGAEKLLSPLWSESSSTSSASDWDSNDEADNHDEQFHEESQELVFSSESKQKIKELLMQEFFSREDSDRLIQIIRSRTVNAHFLAGNQENDLHNTAVIEARKWIEERKKESGPNIDRNNGTCSLSTVFPPAPHITEGKAGSPVDVARTYMRERPPWASPTVNLSEIRSSTPVKKQSVTEGSSYSSLGAVLSPQTKKGDYLASGSWSIAEEVRKVRARVTDELLSTPSRKLDLSAFSLNCEPKSTIVQDDLGENLVGSSSFAMAGVADKGVYPATEVPPSLRSPALDTNGDGLQQEPSSSVPGTDMDDTAAPWTYKETGGLTIPGDTIDLEGGTSVAPNCIRGVLIMPEEVTTEPKATSPSQERVGANTHNEEVPSYTSQATDIPSELDGNSQQTANEESSLDTSKSMHEVILAIQASKKQHRMKQPARRVRGRGK